MLRRAAPLFAADPLNLFVVVEAGDHRVTILDGDRFEPLTRFASRYALVSVREMDGALVVYDAQTFKEVKRLPMKRPVGKYNVYNKITRSEGTSH